MQAKLKTQPYETFDPVYDGAFEAPLDLEYDLPDYCPDVRRILKCQASPEIASYAIAEDTLACDGVCEFRVLYLDAQDGALRCCEFTKDFSASVKVKETGETAVAWVRASVEHLTCRAVSARRIDLHLAVGLRALAVVQRRELITCGVEEDSVEKLVSGHPASQAVNALCHQFTVEEDLPLKNGKPPIEAILRKSVSARVLDTRLGEGQLTVNGAVEVSFLYQSAADSAALERMSASIDFSQVIECAGGGEDCVCDLKVAAGESALQLREDEIGEYTGVRAVVKVFLAAFLYRPCQVDVIDDVYSVREPLELRYAQAALTQVQGVHSEVLRKKCSLSVQEDEIEKVLDLWCEQDSVQSSCEKGKLAYRGKFTVCMLVRGAGGKILYGEKAFDYSASTELEDGQTRRTDTASRAEIWEYRITDKNTVEVSVETPVSTFLSSRTAVRYLVSASADEDAEAPAVSPCLTVYYASKGERLWEIAKSHKALLSDLRAQNGLLDDTLQEDRPLLITTR